MKYILIVISISLLNQFVNGQTVLRINNIDSLFKYAENNSQSVKTGDQQVLLAKWQKISAQTGIVNFRVPTNFYLTDNIAQQVTFLPAEVFGGQPGTFKQVTTGQ